MYEARQNKEKVSRRIDEGGMARQRVKIENGRKINQHIMQMICYSVNNNGRPYNGNISPGSQFSASVVKSFYQPGAITINTVGDLAQDELTNNVVIRQGSIVNHLAEADHIVPKNLGGGGLESNCRIINAQANRSRGDNFYTHQGNYNVADVVIVDNNHMAHTDVAEFLNIFNAPSVIGLFNAWQDPWNNGRIHFGPYSGNNAIQAINQLIYNYRQHIRVGFRI